MSFIILSSLVGVYVVSHVYVTAMFQFTRVFRDFVHLGLSILLYLCQFKHLKKGWEVLD